MSLTYKIAKYQAKDVLRSRWLIGFTFFLGVISSGLFYFTADTEKVIVSLINIVFTIVPLIGAIFGALYYYNSKEYIIFLLSQPLKRKQIFLGLYSGIVFPLSLSLVSGLGLPVVLFIVRGSFDYLVSLIVLIGLGAVLLSVFIGISLFLSILNDDKAKGLGFTLLLWLLFSFIYDGIVLLILTAFSEYPLEVLSIVLSMLNPIDLARIIVLLNLDISVLMGYTGAIFQKFFGSFWGMALTTTALFVWIIVPLILTKIFFAKKDF